MGYIFAVMSVWLIFIGCITNTKNMRSAVIIKIPFFIFAVFVGLYSLNMFGLLSFTI